MISKQESVLGWITQACAGVRVCMNYPASWTSVPCVAVYESQNREYARADGQEHLTELFYTVDIWTEDAQSAADIADAVDQALRARGLRREACAEMFEEKTRYRRRNLRYRAVCDRAGTIYQ